VEIWPWGDPRALRQIEIVGIVNVGYAGEGRSRYEVRSKGRLAEVEHRRSEGALKLVALAIAALEEDGRLDPLATEIDAEGDAGPRPDE